MTKDDLREKAIEFCRRKAEEVNGFSCPITAGSDTELHIFDLMADFTHEQLAAQRKRISVDGLPEVEGPMYWTRKDGPVEQWHWYGDVDQKRYVQDNCVAWMRKVMPEPYTGEV